MMTSLHSYVMQCLSGQQVSLDHGATVTVEFINCVCLFPDSTTTSGLRISWWHHEGVAPVNSWQILASIKCALTWSFYSFVKYRPGVFKYHGLSCVALAIFSLMSPFRIVASLCSILNEFLIELPILRPTWCVWFFQDDLLNGGWRPLYDSNNQGLGSNRLIYCWLFKLSLIKCISWPLNDNVSVCPSDSRIIFSTTKRPQ